MLRHGHTRPNKARVPTGYYTHGLHACLSKRRRVCGGRRPCGRVSSVRKKTTGKRKEKSKAKHFQKLSSHPDVVEDSLKLQRLILSLHGSWIQTIAAINELDDVAGGAAYCQVVL